MPKPVLRQLHIQEIMNASDTVLLSSLQIDEVFQFGQPRRGKMGRGEIKPRWKVVSLGEKSCVVSLESSVAATQSKSFTTAPPILLSSGTLVQRVIESV